jgi:hypothetical protein
MVATFNFLSRQKHNFALKDYLVNVYVLHDMYFQNTTNLSHLWSSFFLRYNQSYYDYGV